MRRRTSVALGDPVPVVPYGDFSLLPGKETAALWDVIGPTVERNLRARVPLHLIFCACYAQGIENGASLGREKECAT